MRISSEVAGAVTVNTILPEFSAASALVIEKSSPPPSGAGVMGVLPLPPPEFPPPQANKVIVEKK